MLRELAPDDRAAAMAFCAAAPFMRINLRALVAAGAADTRVVAAGGRALAACTAAGVLAVDGDEAIAELCVRAVGTRTLRAIMGTPQIVETARASLGLTARAATLDREELVMGLELAAMTGADGRHARRAIPGDHEALVALRLGYWAEAFDMTIDDAARTRAQHEVAAQLQRGTLWAIDEGGAVAGCMAVQLAFPEIISIGSGYVTPAARARGALHALVSAALLDARARGVERVVFFTTNPATLRSMGRLGFVEIGRHRGLMF